MAATDSGPAGPGHPRPAAGRPAGSRRGRHHLAADGGTAGPDPRRVAFWVLAAIVALVIAGVVITVIAHQRTDTMSFQTSSFKVTAPNVLSVTFDVDKAPLTEVRCSVIAQDIYHAVIGQVDEAVVSPRSDGRRNNTVTVDIPVNGTPVSGSVTDCRLTRTR